MRLVRTCARGRRSRDGNQKNGCQPRSWPRKQSVRREPVSKNLPNLTCRGRSGRLPRNPPPRAVCSPTAETRFCARRTLERRRREQGRGRARSCCTARSLVSLSIATTSAIASTATTCGSRYPKVKNNIPSLTLHFTTCSSQRRSPLGSYSDDLLLRLQRLHELTNDLSLASSA